MAFYWNGSTVNTVIFNGVTCGAVYFNGTSVLAAVTATPSIGAGAYFGSQWYIPVTNNDSSTATIYGNDFTPPTTDRGAASPGGSVTSYSTRPSFATFTHYARATATGKSASSITSRTIT